MNDIIKGFQTNEGVKKYDYGSLANTPTLDFVKKEEVVTVSIPDKIVRVNADNKLPVDITGDAGRVEWSKVSNKPSSLGEYGLSDEVYSKEQTYSKEEVYSKDEVYSKEEVYSKDEVYSKEETLNKEEINKLFDSIDEVGSSSALALKAHNESEEAHEFIRAQITQLSKRFSTLFDSTDEELDQISELVSFIKENRSLIEAIKIPTKLSELQQDETHRLVTDEEKEKWNQPKIEVDTTLTETGKAADAASVGNALEQKQPKGDYAFKNEIPTKLAQLETDNENLRVSQAEKDNWNTPKITIDKTLSQSNAAADAKTVGDKINNITPVFQNEAPTSQMTLWVDINDDSSDGSIIDETLTQTGMAADAGEVGRRLNNLVIPSKLSDLQEDVSHRTVTDAEKEKLAGIDIGANKTVVDSSLSSTSTNPVQNKVVNQAIQNLDNKIGKTSVAEQMTVKQDKHIPLSITLTASGWSNNLQTVIANGVTTNNTVIVTSAPQNWLLYQEANVYCSQQMENSLTFTCETIPSSDLMVNVVILS